ncbi:MAG: thioesterase family protein [Bacteroidia bacterium]|jgi:YbgC/YbaW family acyl-CoA thioester hydrolase
MSRTPLQLPDAFQFNINIAVRITDINYGNHLGNDKYLAYMQEARVCFFAQWGYTEMDIEGISVIMGDSVLVYKQEAYYGDILTFEIAAGGFGKSSFDLFYRITHSETGTLICEAKTGMVCYDYATHKTKEVPEKFSALFT